MSKAYLIRPEIEAEAVRDTDGNLTVRWTADADSVDLFLGTRPDRIAHTKPLAHVEGKKEVSLPDPAPKARCYFALRFHGGPSAGKTVTVAERFIPLKGAVNFRDVGGYRTADGHHVRWGRVYRSEGLSKLTAEDDAYLIDVLNLHQVCDLRGASEIKAAPDRLPEPGRLETINLPIDSGSAGMRQMMPALVKGDIPGVDAALTQAYIDMVDTHGADVFGLYLARLADAKHLPSVVHCTAGKDRTGIATALLLSLLGVPRNTVIAEYSLTNLSFDALSAELKSNNSLAAFGLTPEKLAPVMIANPAWMEHTLDHIDQKYGSVEGYLKTAAHLDEETLARIRANLLQ